ncbi:hypothetical protein AT302_20795 [Pandoraea norimbergensis]|uniref:DUF637 domain-containing protein n=2 Tax=Pandoraea norimbergensis TaxID=93219 RepID=A0ABN4JLG3_9BURK|nr:hypothetical protein AT302_20795 [Pandoraea norimbergensis]
MIRRPQELMLMRLGLPMIPANGGSESESSASTSAEDKRVVTDHGIGVSGNSNQVVANIGDLGAITAAFDFATTANKTAHDDMTSAVGLAQGAINTNADLFKTNAKSLFDNLGGLIDFAKDTAKTAQEVNQTATQAVAGAYSTAQEISNGQKFLVAGGLVIAGIVAVTALKGKIL